MAASSSPPESLAPATVEELRDELHRCGEEQCSIETGGSFSKRLVGGSVPAARYRLTTSRMDRLLAYEPADLTVSAEAGMRFAELSRILAENNQFLPLDPPFGADATLGGVLAANSSGPRRRRYGTARDMVIGMRFATLDGKLVSSGGMVVKNVTGLDMGKLMIGSFGTLAVIASANFKIFPIPESSVTFAFRAASTAMLLELRRSILQGVLQPVAVDWLDPAAAAMAGLGDAQALLVEASGSGAATRRYTEDFGRLAASEGARMDSVEAAVWDGVRECVPRWLAAHPDGAAVRVSTVPTRLEELLAAADASGCGAILRAGNATGHLLARDRGTTRTALDMARQRGFRAVLESASGEVREGLVAWDADGNELDVMRRVKADFDPLHLLNRGRLYGVI